VKDVAWSSQLPVPLPSSASNPMGICLGKVAQFFAKR
jgi:hypothetical protein